MKLKHGIDAHKGMTAPVVLLLMFLYDNWSMGTWTYLALHGTYGVMWIIKSNMFPDPAWEQRSPLWKVLGVWVMLLGYWVAPFVLIYTRATPPPWLVCVAIVANALGTMLHYGSDAQKYYVLKVRPGLITDGFFARTRNPNYLGEMLIYGSFAALTMHWLPWVVLAVFWAGLFLPNMIKKDRSISRHEGWQEYAARSRMLLPRIFVGSRGP